MTTQVETIDESTLEDISLQEREEIITAHYLRKLFLWIFSWAVILILFTWIIDPYGVSPIQINLPGINTYKPMRLDRDRLIKPFEVWRYQPKTVFLGTSRIHQSMDPAEFDGTQYAPAYNAAIPASSLEENARHIEQYLKLDSHIKDIFIELFFYNFTTGQSPQPVKTWKEFINNYFSLQFSYDTFLDSIRTLYVNHKKVAPDRIAKLGNRIHGSDFNPATTFNEMLYIHTVIGWDKAAKMSLQPSAFASLDHIVELARQHHVHLHMLMTPNYPWDDYRLMTLGYWPLLEKWLRKMATYSDVVSFSQYNAYLEEKPLLDPPMKFWNDPTHFSANMGRAMLHAYLGRPAKDAPKNLMLPLNSKTVEEVIAKRRDGALHWAASHPHFVNNFDDSKMLPETVQGTLNQKILTVNHRNYPITLGVGEISFSLKQGDILTASGWAIDEMKKRNVTQLIATIGSSVVAGSYPTVQREDIIHALGNSPLESGFNIDIPLSTQKNSKAIRVFALLKDGRAVQLTSQDSLIDGMPFGSLGSVQTNKLIIHHTAFPITNDKVGSIENMTQHSDYINVNGWAADIKHNKPVVAIVATVNSKIVAKTFPTMVRDDKNVILSGFSINVPMQAGVKEDSFMKIFALMTDGTACPLGVVS